MLLVSSLRRFEESECLDIQCQKVVDFPNLAGCPLKIKALRFLKRQEILTQKYSATSHTCGIVGALTSFYKENVYYIILYYIISYHIVSYHIIYHIIYHIPSHHIIYHTPHNTTSHHITSHHITSHTSSYHIISYHIYNIIYTYYINNYCH